MDRYDLLRFKYNLVNHTDVLLFVFMQILNTLSELLYLIGKTLSLSFNRKSQREEYNRQRLKRIMQIEKLEKERNNMEKYP